MKRVFHIISRFDVGGAESVAINIAMSNNSGYEHHIIELQRGHSEYTGKIIQELEDKHVIYHRSMMPIYFHLHCYVDRLISLLFPIRFLFLWLRYRPDVVHTHTEMPDMALWWTMTVFPFIRCKVVRTIHNTVLWSGMDVVGPKVERFMQQHKANVAISENVRDAYSKRFNDVPPVIYNGVAASPQRRYDQLRENMINICFAGRFEEQKGIDVLCDIIRSVSSDRYFFHIFGSGRQQSLVDTLRDMPNVSINPPLHGISSYLSSFDYLIMPSRHEGLSILALEASFNGLPLMINNCAGLSDTLPDDWPLAVNNNDISQWKALFDDIPTANRTSLQEKALMFVSEHFSIGKMQTEYEQFYSLCR